MTLEEIDAFRSSASDGILSKTISKPFKDEGWKIGKNGGVWNGTISADPKSFNLLIAERDASTSGILSYLTDSLVDYNYVKREWQARLADFEISTDEKNGTLDVIYTLRDDIFWSFYGNSQQKVKITSDDVVFWYDGIDGDDIGLRHREHAQNLRQQTRFVMEQQLKGNDPPGHHILKGQNGVAIFIEGTAADVGHAGGLVDGCRLARGKQALGLRHLQKYFRQRGRFHYIVFGFG